MINPTACVRKKMSDNAKQRFSNPNNHPFFGKKHTQESIEKNRISNLEHPITQEMREKQKQNTPKGEQCHSAKLTVSDIPKIKDMLKNISIKETANLYGVSYTCIWEIQKGRTWLNDPA